MAPHEKSLDWRNPGVKAVHGHFKVLGPARSHDHVALGSAGSFEETGRSERRQEPPARAAHGRSPNSRLIVRVTPSRTSTSTSSLETPSRETNSLYLPSGSVIIDGVFS